MNKVENLVGRHDERIQDNKETILDVRENVKEIQKSIVSGIRWVFGAIAVPTGLILYQLISKQ